MNRAGITADDPDVQRGEWQVLWDWYSCQHVWKLLECGAITANEFAALAEPFPRARGVRASRHRYTLPVRMG